MDEDSLFAQNASLLGQVVQQWKLRMVARGAALEKVANGK